jgi:(2Fe-2S) ferredoxin
MVVYLDGVWYRQLNPEVIRVGHLRPIN